MADADIARPAGVLTGVTILALVIGVAWLILRPKGHIVYKPLSLAPTTVAPATSTSAPAPERDPLAEARELRGKAFEECTRNDWRACLNDLASASALDHVRPYAPKKSP